MKELGKESENAHRAIGKKVLEINPDYTFIIGSEMAFANEELSQGRNVKYYTESSETTFCDIAKIINEVIEDKDVILLKGSHSMELDKLYSMMIKE